MNTDDGNNYDVAREAGVSMATVSRVVTGNSELSKKTLGKKSSGRDWIA